MDQTIQYNTIQYNNKLTLDTISFTSDEEKGFFANLLTKIKNANGIVKATEKEKLSRVFKLCGYNPDEYKELINLKKWEGSPYSIFNFGGENLYQSAFRVLSSALIMEEMKKRIQEKDATKNSEPFYYFADFCVVFPREADALLDMGVDLYDTCAKLTKDNGFLARQFKNHTNTFTKLWNENNGKQDTPPVLGRTLNALQIAQIVEPYEKNPNEVKEILNIRDSRGEYRFDCIDVKPLITPYINAPDAVKELAKLETSKGEPLFISPEIETLYEKSSFLLNSRDFIERVKALAKLETSKGERRFNIYNIIELAKGGYIKHPNAVVALANKEINGEPKFNVPYDHKWNINDELIESYAKYPDEFERLENYTIEDKPRFNGFDLGFMKLPEALHKFPEETKKLLDMRTPDGKYRFGSEITLNSNYDKINGSLVHLYNLYPNEVEELLDLKYPDGTPRFSAHDIRELLGVYLKYPLEVLECVNLQYNEKHFKGPWIQAEDIAKIADSLANEESGKYTFSLFSGYKLETVTVTVQHTKTPEAVRKKLKFAASGGKTVTA